MAGTNDNINSDQSSVKVSPRRARPLSPHLQIYKPTLTMMMSIAHRLSGIFLYFGFLLMIWWLAASSTGPSAFASVNHVFSHFIMKVILFLTLWAYFHHMFGGIRHFIWDFGKGFDLDSVEWMAILTLVCGFVLTCFVWFFVF